MSSSLHVPIFPDILAIFNRWSLEIKEVWSSKDRCQIQLHHCHFGKIENIKISKIKHGFELIVDFVK